MKLKQLENLVTVDEDVTDDKFGTYYDKRSVEQMLNYGLILLDKPPGPTSHQVVAWAKNCLLYTSPSPRDKRQSRMPSSA